MGEVGGRRDGAPAVGQSGKHPLWPHEDSPGSSPDDGDRRYLVLPSPDDPRLVIPTRPRRSSVAVLQALRDRTSVRARVQTAAIGAAALTNARSQVLSIPPLFDVVADALGRPTGELVFGVHLGPPRANRKPVLAVADRHGGLLAFVKYGVDPLTDLLVAHEARALLELAAAADAGLLEPCTVPTLVASGRHDGHDYAVQTPVPTSAIPTSARRAHGDAVVEAQRAVALVHHDVLDGEQAADAVEQVWHRRVTSSTDPVVSRFAELAAIWTRLVPHRQLTWGSWHGDWRTTNMSVTRRGCSVWDWERFGSGVPVGYDALHLFLTTRLPSVVVLESLPHDVLENAPRLLRPFGVTERSAAELTTAGYLLELAGRYLDDDQAAAGARLGAVGDWLLPALEDLLHSHTSARGGTHR